jgi:hypothetical protein
LWVGLTVRTVRLLLKNRSHDHARSLLQTTQGRSEPVVFTILGRRNTVLVVLDKCRKASVMQERNCIFLLIHAKNIQIRNPHCMVLSL